MARFPSFSLGGREREIVQGIESHLTLVRDCVLAYQKMVSAYAAGKGTLEVLDQVFILEGKSKTMRRELVGKIAEGAFFGGIREDILSLIQTDDHIADSAKDAARLLAIGAEEGPQFASFLNNDHMIAFQVNLLSAVNALTALIEALQLDKKTILSRVGAVEDFEEAADTEKDRLLRQLFGTPRALDPVSIIELRDFLFASDDIADNAERASDVVLVLVAKGYG